jgi:hypothetical protein
MTRLLWPGGVSYRCGEGKEALDGSLIDELRRREAAAREEAEELRAGIAQLAERLARLEERLSRLVIARETVEEALSGVGGRPVPGPPTQSPGSRGAGADPGTSSGQARLRQLPSSAAQNSYWTVTAPARIGAMYVATISRCRGSSW